MDRERERERERGRDTVFIETAATRGLKIAMSTKGADVRTGLALCVEQDDTVVAPCCECPTT